MTSRIHLFPGHASQPLGGCRSLFHRFRELTDQASAELGCSIPDLCLQDPVQLLNRVEYAHSVLFVVNALSFLDRLVDDGRLPHFLAGHGLGEYNAMFAAGVFDFPTGLRIVRQRALFLTSPSHLGRAEIIGLTPDQLREVLVYSGLDSIDLAQWDAPDQLVISGLAADLEAVQPALKMAGAQSVRRFTTSACLGSRSMAEPAQAFAAFLDPLPLAPPRIPVLSNVTALPHQPAMLKANLARQFTDPIRWTESMQWLLRQPAPVFWEIGPGTGLTELVDRIRGAGQMPPACSDSKATPPA